MSVKLLCTECGNEYYRPLNKALKGSKFCSRPCKRACQRKKTSLLEQRFWERVDRRNPDECWLWLAGKTTGYGTIWNGTKDVLAHRLSYELEHGYLSDSMDVCHTCDNPTCVNPNHLFLGTHRDNMVDRDKKGRGKIPDNRGENHGLARLTKLQVIEIFSLRGKESRRITANRYGISSGYVSRIQSRKAWEWLTKDLTYG